LLALRPSAAGGQPRLVWETRENAQPVEYDREPARSGWQRLKVDLLSLLPMDSEL
jgi:putative cardiolipin synthase